MRYPRYSEEWLDGVLSKVKQAGPVPERVRGGNPQGVPSTKETAHRLAPSPYKSKWESAYAAKLELEKAAGLIKQWWYEPFSLWLPGKVRYKPDFMVQIETQVGQPSQQLWQDELQLIEVKGWSKNLRDGKTRLKIAAALFPCFVWRLVYRTKGGGWDGEYV